MLTVTFTRYSSKGFKVTQDSIEKAIKHLLRLINCDLFGRRRTDKGWTIAHAVTVDFGLYGEHPHVHLLLAAPSGVTEEQLRAMVERAANRTTIVDRQRHYSNYFSAGGAAYLIKHGTDRMVVPLISPERHGK
jgi:hypothetical protein